MGTNFPQLIEEGDHIEKPDSVLSVAIFKGQKRIVVRARDFSALDLGPVGPAHCFRETDLLGFFSTNGPVVSITSHGNDPLFGVGIFQQNVQPTLEPGPGSQRPGRIRVRGLVKQESNEPIYISRQEIKIDVIKLLIGLHTEPEFLVIVMQRIGQLVDECGNLFFVSRIDLLPIEHDPGGSGIAQRAQNLPDEAILPISRSMSEIFNRFRLPFVAHQVCQKRHQSNPLAGGKLWQTRVGIDLQFPEPIDHCHPFRAEMGDLGGMLLE